ncbi:DNA alkylation repair protein [Glutamicibacter sp. 287]|uniref:DNA alkylation repair protein n=1 Tax=unclassified Glutamicibacter TaxID=2627139 RepID=UPI000BB840B7|nr:DNA alkylation repair protein [Glutamicibacter sp. BW80]PCC27332.1 DNA alkylation repair protein [Glutamicibacter sp. BW80]
MPFADQLIGADVAEQLAHEIQAIVPEQPLQFLPAASAALAELSLRERADALRDALLSEFPEDYARLATVIREASERSATFTGWMIWPVTSAVATRAVRENTSAAFNDAMALLAALTGRLTAEFAIRTLLIHDLDKALEIAEEWTRSPDEHVRRLASEGTRPYLPWAVRVPQLTATPGRTIPILDALYRDESQYVRRSVANHLNDLSRDAPQLVTQTARRWLQAPEKTTLPLVKHGLRTLIKRGDPQALAVLGFAPATLEIDGPRLGQQQVPWGGSVEFTAAIRNAGAEPSALAIDYLVHHLKANGSTSAKVFKLATRTLAPGESLDIGRSHSFRAITTRRYYPGLHGIALQINGVPTHTVHFELLAEPPG